MCSCSKNGAHLGGINFTFVYCLLSECHVIRMIRSSYCFLLKMLKGEHAEK